MTDRPLSSDRDEIAAACPTCGGGPSAMDDRLVSHGLRLDAPRLETDGRALWDLMAGDDQYLSSTLIDRGTYEGFLFWLRDRLASDFACFSVVRPHDAQDSPCSRERGTGMSAPVPVGVAYAYGLSLADGTCSVCACVSDALRGTGAGAVAAALFLRHLFDEYPLRAVYATAYRYNTRSLEGLRGAGFEEEGCLRSFRYYRGSWHDLVWLSMGREAFEAALGRLL